MTMFLCIENIISKTKKTNIKLRNMPHGKTPPVVADFEGTGREYTLAKGSRREKEKDPFLEFQKEHRSVNTWF